MVSLKSFVLAYLLPNRLKVSNYFPSTLNGGKRSSVAKEARETGNDVTVQFPNPSFMMVFG
jgi:hypothetical protein